MFDLGTANQIMDAMWGAEPRIAPTNKLLRDALKGKCGGSSSNISDAVWNWKVRHGLCGPGAEVRTPRAAAARSKDAKTALTGAARKQARTHSQDDLARLIEQAKLTADKLARVEGRLLALEADNRRLQERVVAARRQRLPEFRDRVMNVVADILTEHPNLTFYDMMELIPANLSHEAKSIAVRLDADTLARKMSVQADLGGSGDMAEEG